MILLEWEKAFDKIYNEKLFQAMRRLGVDEHLIQVTMAIYEKPMFRVSMEGNTSEWKTQETGIRQGCPLSPYLFLIVMTVIFKDLHRDDHLNTIRWRQNNWPKDEILYADDTILISPNTRALNRILAELEEAAGLYGLRLNRNQCVALPMYGDPNIHFKNGEPVNNVDEAVYLGVLLTKTMNTKKEAKIIIQMAMSTMKKLDEFWIHSNCSKRLNMLVYTAVIRSKLLYGLESAQLPDHVLAQLNTVQLQGFRKILGWKTTYVDRNNTNARLLLRTLPGTRSEIAYTHIKTDRRRTRKGLHSTAEHPLPLDQPNQENRTT